MLPKPLVSMQLAPGRFEGLTTDNAFSAPDTYCLTAAGIKAGEYSYVMPWPTIEVIEAWKTTGDGNDGWEEIGHLRVRDSQGNTLQLSDWAEATFFTDLQLAIT